MVSSLLLNHGGSSWVCRCLTRACNGGGDVRHVFRVVLFQRDSCEHWPLPSYRNKHIMIDLGTGNNNKINWAMEDKQEMIDIIETVYRGARKGRGLVVSPKDYSTKYRYWARPTQCTSCPGVILMWKYFQLFKAFENAFGKVHGA